MYSSYILIKLSKSSSNSTSPLKSSLPPPNLEIKIYSPILNFYPDIPVPRSGFLSTKYYIYQIISFQLQIHPSSLGFVVLELGSVNILLSAEFYILQSSLYPS